MTLSFFLGKARAESKSPTNVEERIAVAVISRRERDKVGAHGHIECDFVSGLLLWLTQAHDARSCSQEKNDKTRISLGMAIGLERAP